MSAILHTPLDVLLPYQRAWYDDPARFKCGIWSRQTGKDFSTAAEMVGDCMPRDRAAATTWMIAAPSERQSIESLAKCRDWSTAFDVAIADIIEDRDAPNTLLKSSTILFANGSRIIAVPGRPDTVRGMSANIVLTEFAFFEDPDATWKAVLPSIINPLRGGEKKVRIISTPNGKTGPGRRFFEIVDQNLPGASERSESAALSPRKQTWSVHRVTIADAVAQGLPVDIAELRAALNDEEAFAQECMCEFIDGSSVLLPYDLIALAESSDATEVCDPELFNAPGGHELYCGIDFGRVSDPAVCWTLERVGPLLLTKEVLVLRGVDTPDQQDILRSRISAARRTSFDYTGPGIGLGDHLVKEHGRYDPDKHEFGKVELCTFTAPFKRLLFPRLRKTFEAPTQIRVPISIATREDLHAMQQTIRNGEYTYHAPRTAEGHSDRCTAAALAVRAAGDGPGTTFAPRPFSSRRSAIRRSHRAAMRAHHQETAA
jgi:phage FluMu gp28-like protein